MTRLDALRTILERAGVNPPATVDTSGASDGAQANRILDRENLDIQSQGWTFNRVRRATLFKAVDGTITPPEAAIVVRSADTNTDEVLVAIGETVYNVAVDENTFEFAEDQEADYHLLWKFECVPHPIQRYIVESAAVGFIEMAAERLRISGWRLQTARGHLQRAMEKAHRYDNWQGRVNLLNTPAARKFRGYRPDTLRGETGH